MKKLLPVAFIVLLAIAALFLRWYNSQTPGIQSQVPGAQTKTRIKEARFDRRATKLFFTKHARCRMKCRQITQEEVKEILAEGKINYSKSRLDDQKGPSYALEGTTSDRQHVRIIFAPKQKHMSVVTVIDLEVDYQCDC